MPQYLTIKANGADIATMMTSNVSDTSYDVFWQQMGCETIKLLNVDTGIQRQPQMQSEQEEDFVNDFIHVRRVLGAAYTTSEIFKKNVKTDNDLKKEIDEIQIELKTNDFFRGNVFIKIDDNNLASMTVEIGSGSERFPNSHPKAVDTFTKNIQRPTGSETPLIFALNILKSEGVLILKNLEKRA